MMESKYIHAIFWCSLYALIGLAVFEWSWCKVKPLRNVNEERDSKYPAFRRYDAVRWSKWKFYPGAVLLLPLRCILTILCLIICYIFTRFFTICHDLRRSPLIGWRQKGLMYSYQFCSWALMQSLSMRSGRRKVDFDYSEYLGTDYKKTTVYPKRVSTLVCNHQSWVDMTMLFQYFRNAFVSKASVINAPVMGLVAQAMSCIFIGRGVSQADRDGLVNQITDRQRQVEEEGDVPHFVIFPEGGTSNGTCLLPFKRGAFMANKAVRPIVMKCSYSVMSPCYDVIPMIPLAFLNMCLLGVYFDVIELPPFVPNDYLYRTHADKVVVSSATTEAPAMTMLSPGRGGEHANKDMNSEGPSFTINGVKGVEFKPIA